MTTASCIYEGQVRHRRFSPKPHNFAYRLFMIYLDLGELDTVFEGSLFWSTRRLALAQFRQEDHWGEQSIPLSQSISQLIESHTGCPQTGPIRLLTHLRYFGYCFNPVSFYFCFDDSDSYLQTVVAEVNNTPWGDRHCYVLDEVLNEGDRDKKHYRFEKDFHVSPFMDMNVEYDWYFTRPGTSLGIHMENRESEEKFFDATLTLQRREIDTRSLHSVLLRYPFMTGKIIAAVYWNAMRLWLKGCPFYTHPGKLEKSQEVPQE